MGRKRKRKKKKKPVIFVFPCYITDCVECFSAKTLDTLIRYVLTCHGAGVAWHKYPVISGKRLIGGL